MQETSVLILGIGNLLWADEGFGVRAVEEFYQQYTFPDHVQLMDGGTQGLALVPYVQQADVLIIFDAIDYGLPPGTMKVIRDQEVPNFMGAKKMSLHQTGFQEVLSTAELLGNYPSKLLLIGVQPVDLEDYGGSLRPQVKAQIEPALQAAINFLAELNIAVNRRPQQPDDQQLLSAASLSISAYEAERPSEAAACRSGDARVLASAEIEFDPKKVLDECSKLSVNLELRRQD
jgi:hydrogenase maturation protease